MDGEGSISDNVGGGKQVARRYCWSDSGMQCYIIPELLLEFMSPEGIAVKGSNSGGKIRGDNVYTLASCKSHLRAFVNSRNGLGHLLVCIRHASSDAVLWQRNGGNDIVDYDMIVTTCNELDLALVNRSARSGAGDGS